MMHGEGRTGVMRVLLAAVILACFGCSGNPQTAKKEGDGKRLFGVVLQTMNNPFFVELVGGLEEVIESKGDELLVLDSQFNSLKQRNDISDLILKGAATIFINPVNWEGIKGSLLQAKEKNVPCIVVDAPVKDEDLVLCQVASDNLEAGRLAARALAEVRRPAKVVILHLSVNKACIDRVEGFKEELAKYPDMGILDIQEGKGTTEGGRPVMRDLLGRFPDLNAVFPINDPSALGAISALESAGKLADVTVVTVDGSAEGIAAIKAGKLHSTSAQFPRRIGKTSAEKAYDHLEGRPVEKNVVIPVELVTRENADAFLEKK
ncbi:MAG: sugar ABC transporter substrate-binding protein [Candidatus Omnitrophica bacterium]|nr:Ribose import binding protein RbsB [bacterium]NUN94856.1 sugar ABC transporter substrate-binding protein [Candidatus Omnitrophota bacterium]